MVLLNAVSVCSTRQHHRSEYLSDRRRATLSQGQYAPPNHQYPRHLFVHLHENLLCNEESVQGQEVECYER